MKRLLLLFLSLLLVLLVACQASTSQIAVTETPQPPSTAAPATETVEAPTETPSAAELATATPTTETPAASASTPSDPAPPTATLGEVTRYVDETAGVALLYPAGWSVLDVDPALKQESPAYAVTFQSWDLTEPGEGGIPEGATKFDLGIISDTQATSLEEAVAERRAQLAGAEMGPVEILAEQRVRLGNGLEAVRWLLESQGEQSVLYVIYGNERMILISGLGDFQKIDAIAQTVEMVPSDVVDWHEASD